jgi:aromatic ring-opening dioxygenase LigB subunit
MLAALRRAIDQISRMKKTSSIICFSIPIGIFLPAAVAVLFNREIHVRKNHTLVEQVYETGRDL